MSTKIVKALVKGFKSHIDSEFNYAPGLTVVTGPTDSGKSAGVMQPVKWVAFGEPSGEAFLFTIRDPKTHEIVRQAEAAEVELHTNDGLVVLKTRRKGKTAYYINGKLVSEKADVPEEVKESLGLSKQNYGEFETSLNFAYQLEAPFILSETASVGAKVLGKLAGTEIVDKAIAAISKRTYKARDEKNTAQKIIDQSNVELIEYLQVDDLLAKVQACEVLLELLDQDNARLDAIGQQAARYSVLSDKMDECNQKLERLAVVVDLGGLLGAVVHNLAFYEALQQIYSQYNHLGDVLEAIEKRITALKDIGAAVILLNQLETDYSLYTQLNEYCKDLTNYEGQIQAVEIQLEDYKAIPEAARLIIETDQEYDRLVRIESLYDGHESLSGQLVESESIIGDCKDLPTISKLLSSLEQDAEKAQQLCDSLGALRANEGLKNRPEARLKALEVLPDCKTSLEEAIEYFDKLTELKQLTSDYNIKQQAVEAGEKKAAGAVPDLTLAEIELKAAWEAAGDVCPLCERPMADDHTYV